MVRAIAHEAMRGISMLHGPVALDICMYLMPPASWSKKQKTYSVFATGRPDVDNIAKLLADSINGICYRDDSQIAILNIARYYTLTGPERVQVSLRSLVADIQVAA
jgi:Holliday junction resolvase RusA-like endonuclease